MNQESEESLRQEIARLRAEIERMKPFQLQAMRLQSQLACTRLAVEELAKSLK